MTRQLLHQFQYGPDHGVGLLFVNVQPGTRDAVHHQAGQCGPEERCM